MNNPTSAPENDPTMKIGWREKLGYAAGDMASCLYFGIFMNFLAIFYTDVFGIAPAALGTMLLIVRTWDWINDPIMGAIADRTETKMGKFRPWILWMIVPYMVFGVLTFTTFDLGPTMKLVYAYFTYTTLMMIYTAINVPYGALMGVMTAKSEERTVLAAFRFVGANTGIFAVTLMLPYLVKTFGQGDVQQGYAGAMVLISLLAGGLFYFTFLTCHERVRQVETKQESFREELKQLARNGPWLIVIALSVLTVMGQAIRATTTLHYFKYNVGNEGWGTTLLLYNSVVAVIAVLMSKSLCAMIGCKRRAYVILNLAFAALLVWFYFIPVTSFPLMLANQVMIALVAAPMMPIFWSMIADTADYGAVKFGHRSTGVIFSAGTASQKIGWTVGPAVALMFLGGAGYVANTTQTPETLSILHQLMSLIPAVFAVLTAIVTCFYPIDRKMELELEAAVSKQAAAARA